MYPVYMNNYKITITNFVNKLIFYPKYFRLYAKL